MAIQESTRTVYWNSIDRSPVSLSSISRIDASQTSNNISTPVIAHPFPFAWKYRQIYPKSQVVWKKKKKRENLIPNRKTVWSSIVAAKMSTRPPFIIIKSSLNTSNPIPLLPLTRPTFRHPLVCKRETPSTKHRLLRRASPMRLRNF